MKTKSLFLSAIMALLVGVGTASANLLVNPGFESPGEETDHFGADQATLVDGWMNPAGTTTGETGVRGPINMGNGQVVPHEGDWMGLLHVGNRSVQQTTEHVIQSGEWFKLSFWGSVTGGANPRHHVQVYYLDESDERVPFYDEVLQPEDFHPEGKSFWTGRDENDVPPWIFFEIETDVVPAAAVGRNVGVWFTNSVYANNIVFDDVSLTAIPEPGTLVLLGLAGLLLLKRRRV